MNGVENCSNVVPRDGKTVDVLVKYLDGVGRSWGGRKMVNEMVDSVEMKVVFLFVYSGGREVGGNGVGCVWSGR